MKLYLSILLVSSVLFLKDWHVGQWNFKNVPSGEYKIPQETIDLTETVLSNFYINFEEDYTYEMEIKGTVHRGKYKFNKDQSELTVMSDESGILKFQLLRHDEKEMVLRMFNVYTVLIEKTDS